MAIVSLPGAVVAVGGGPTPVSSLLLLRNTHFGHFLSLSTDRENERSLLLEKQFSLNEEYGGLTSCLSPILPLLCRHSHAVY